MAKTTITYRIEWIPFDTDLSKCRCCNEEIYSKMIVLCLTPMIERFQNVSDPTEVKVCESCFDLICHDDEQS